MLGFYPPFAVTSLEIVLLVLVKVALELEVEVKHLEQFVEIFLKQLILCLSFVYCPLNHLQYLGLVEFDVV